MQINHSEDSASDEEEESEDEDQSKESANEDEQAIAANGPNQDDKQVDLDQISRFIQPLGPAEKEKLELKQDSDGAPNEQVQDGIKRNARKSVDTDQMLIADK